nr:MAG TPA: hypothetical protein [Bacteriophage sp.]
MLSTYSAGLVSCPLITLKIYFPSDLHLLSNYGEPLAASAALAFFMRILVSLRLTILSPPHNSIYVLPSEAKTFITGLELSSISSSSPIFIPDFSFTSNTYAVSGDDIKVSSFGFP